MNIDFELIKKLQKELDELLEQKPELRFYQKQIEDAMKKAGDNPHNRLAVLNNMLIEKKIVLIKAMKELQKECMKLKDLL